MIYTPGPGRFAALALAALVFSVSASAAPGRLDAGKRSPRFTTEDKATLPDSRTPEGNAVIQDRRFEAGDTVEKKSALVGERRADFEVGETQEKTLFRTPDRPAPEIIERKDNPWGGKRSRFSTGDDAYRSKVATRFQDKIGDAHPLGGEVKTAAAQRTTFDRANRFAFRRNTGDNPITVNAAGSEEAALDASGRSSLTAPGATLGPPTARTRVSDESAR